MAIEIIKYIILIMCPILIFISNASSGECIIKHLKAVLKSAKNYYFLLFIGVLFFVYNSGVYRSKL